MASGLMMRRRVLVLEEAPVAAAQIGGVGAADHFERRHLHDRDTQTRFVRDDLDRVGFERCAGQREIEVLADPDRAGAGAPPAADRIDFDRGRSRVGGLVRRRLRVGRRDSKERKHERDEAFHKDLSGLP